MTASSQQWFWNQTTQFKGDLLFDEPLARHTYYHAGGPARVFSTPKNLEDLKILIQGIQVTSIPYFILGVGTNLLASDTGFDGLVIKTGKLNLETVLLNSGSEMVLRTGTSVAVSSVLRRASQEGWGGLEFLTGIPGSIGGVVSMNAGTHLGEVKDHLVSVQGFSLLENPMKNPIIYGKEQFKFEYRKNLFIPEGCLIYSADWAIRKTDPLIVKKIIDENLARRKSTQPIDYPSCGSVFKNPKKSGQHAWQVIDQLWLRGHTIGGAQFSEKHCNFIINLGNATATDIKALIDLAKSRAEKELGITLEEEVKFLGKF